MAAVALGALLVFGCGRLMRQADDEDRPPIIVKGGSLVIESGLSNRDGKEWKSTADYVWEQVHDRGKPVTAFQIYFEGGTIDEKQNPCPPAVVDQVQINYDPDDAGSGQLTAYYVEVERGGGKRVPKARGSGLNRSENNPKRLEVTGSSTTIINIIGFYQNTPRITCNKPTAAYLEAFK